MDVKAALESEEGKAAIAKAIEEATKPLAAKRDELLEEKKKLAGTLKEFQTQLDEIKEAKDAAEMEAAKKSGDVEKLVANAVSKKEKEIENLNKKFSELEGKYSTEVVDRTFGDALTKAGIVPDLIEDVRTVLRARHKVEIGESGPTIEGKPISDFVSEWSQSDAAKRYKAAPDNGGGGARGSNGGGKATDAKADMGGNRTERSAAIAKKFPELSQNQ